MGLVNDVELSISEAPGNKGNTTVSLNGVPITGLVAIDISAARDTLTEVTLKFYARVNKPKSGTGEGE